MVLINFSKSGFVKCIIGKLENQQTVLRGSNKEKNILLLYYVEAQNFGKNLKKCRRNGLYMEN
jgi:hypothetical protein